MSKIDKAMNKYSVLKNFALPAGPTDGRTSLVPKTKFDPFAFGNWGNTPNKLFAPWSAPETSKISSYIAPVQFQRLRHDINMWREAVREADLAILPYRVKMQRMYVDTVLNPHIQACMLKRKNLTLLRDFDIVDENDRPDDDYTKMFKEKWFYDFISLTLDSIFYGYSLIQLGQITDNIMEDVELVRRFNISPDRRNVTVFEYAVTGVPFDDPDFGKWLVWVPTMSDIGISNCGYGLLYKVANIELYHRQTLQQNADYCEMFAHPFRLARTDKTEADADRKKLITMMQMMGSQAWGVIDKSDELQFISDASGTGWQSYDAFRKSLEGMMSKVILGHHAAIDSEAGKLGSAQGGDESPVQQAIEEVQSHDGRLIEYVVPRLLFPKLRGLGMEIPDGYRLKYSNDNELFEARERNNATNLILGQALVQLKSAGYKVDVKQIAEMTGLDIEEAEVADPADANQPSGKQLQRAVDIAKKLKLLYGGKEEHTH